MIIINYFNIIILKFIITILDYIIILSYIVKFIKNSFIRILRIIRILIVLFLNFLFDKI